ncbi:hypothetical protein [uncultured Fusobacterium sp.]|uniref:hypothetical protein n=1 Tax=uncultured Fusobacterium sp. TaxID=159267 RepID=UPI0025FDE2B7|nr:hypothetical protein [uncultured Fusobacterium sp.]
MKITYEKQRLGMYTELYKLVGEEDIRSRYIAYNNILFENVDVLSKKEKQIIIINEVGTGGIIYGSVKHADIALIKLRQALSNKNISVIKTYKSDERKKISFSITENWKIEI